MKNKSNKILIILLFILLLIASYFNNKNIILRQNNKDIVINGDTYAMLLDGEFVDRLPSSNAYLTSYNCKNNSIVEWNNKTKELSISKNNSISEKCNLVFKTNPLLSEMKEGDYVMYEGNNGCKKTGTSILDYHIPIRGEDWDEGELESANSCFGANPKEYLVPEFDYLNVYGASPYAHYFVKGWRIAYFDDNRAYLIVAGSSECIPISEYSNENLPNNQYFINYANQKAKKYCNSSFVDGDCSDNSDIWAMNDNDFYKITSDIVNGEGNHIGDYHGSNHCYQKSSTMGCGYNNDLIDNGSFYRIADVGTTSYSRGLYWNAHLRYIDSYTQLGMAYGIRPVIRLSSTVYVTGGSGTMDDPYTIAN